LIIDDLLLIIGRQAELVLDAEEYLWTPNESLFSLLYINMRLKEPISLNFYATENLSIVNSWIFTVKIV